MNVTGDLTSSAGNSENTTADLTVTTTRPGFSKSFAPSSIPRGDRSTLTFVIDNSANPSDLSSLSFTDNLPAGMEIATPANSSNTCGEAGANITFTATPGTSVITLAVFSNIFPGFQALAAGATCSVIVDVVGTGAGMLHNVSGELTASTGGASSSSGKATATLDVTITPLSLTKSFTDDLVIPGDTVTLEFTIETQAPAKMP